MAAMIAIENLRKSYGEVAALSGISFDVPRGQVVGFLGPNGAGKSTTMKILTGFVEATSGSCRVAGINVAKDPVEARRHIGYLPESNPLYEDMMVYDYLEHGDAMRGIPSKDRKKKVYNAVERCGLGPVVSKDIGDLSKGYRQRTGLAHAILHEPDLLILDEPTTGLDPNQIVEIRSLITDLGQEKTVLMSTHVLSEVQATCSRVVIISDGKLVADDAPENLTSESSTVDVVIGAANGTAPDKERVRAMLSTLPGVTDVLERDDVVETAAVGFRLHANEDPRRALFAGVVNEGWVLLQLDRAQQSLEDTFRKLTLEA